LLKVMKIPYPEGRALMQMYRVVPITKRVNHLLTLPLIINIS